MVPGELGDVVALGEVMVRLATDPGIRLEDARTLRVRVGGSECNVAVGLSALGRRCGWISKLADNALGRMTLRRIRETGVDVSRVVWARSARAGTYFVEFGAKPRATRILYDRKGSAASRLRVEDVDWNYVAGFRAIHLTGITPALSAGCRRVVSSAVERARDFGVKISFDVNYRSRLWGTGRALKCIDSLIHRLDVLIVTMSDARSLFKLSGSPDEVLLRLADRYECAVTVLTLGSDGAIALSAGETYRSVGLEVDEIDRIGAGDAFDAGFLHGYLDEDVQRGLDLGSAMAAMKHTMVGDFPIVTEEEVLEIVHRQDDSIRR